MKKVVGTSLALVVILFLLPVAGHFAAQFNGGGAGGAAQSLPLSESGHTLTVLRDGQVETMDLNTYLWGVVAAEMPASFGQEALNAQAVAARTYALYKCGNSVNHPNADVCTDFSCCQAWISQEEAFANWGEDAAFYADKITHAVEDTGEDVVLYDGQLIQAVFHSCAGENTIDAVEVWGNDVPYLKSVSSPEGDEVEKYHTDVTFPFEEFKGLVLGACPEAALDGDPAGWLGEVVRADGGSVHSVMIGGVELSGEKVRVLLNLRSSDFTVETGAEGFTFHVTGFGHGVGLSQYGANAMAAEGAGYREILRHYYTGVTVEPCPAGLYPQ